MADVYFEYTDNDGRTHQVDDVMKVPKQYMRTMVAVGVEEGQTAEGVQAPPPPAKSFALGGGGYVNIVPALLGIIFLRSKNFVTRCLMGAALLVWGLFVAWNWFSNSPLSQTAEREVKKKPAQTQNGVEVAPAGEAQ